MSVAEHDRGRDPRDLAEPPFEEWGDGPAPYAPGERPTRPGDRTPPQDMAAEQSVLGSMLLSITVWAAWRLGGSAWIPIMW